MLVVVPIVEGHGEQSAAGTLIRRIAQEDVPGFAIAVNPPIRIKASSFLQDRPYFNRYILLAAAKAAQARGIVLILLDCEDGCPATLGPRILADAKAARGDAEYLVALAYREYETWFVAAAASLRGVAGLPPDLAPPSNPEAIRGAKEWLGKRMPDGYDPLRHQASFTARFDLDSAAAIPSFRRLRARLAERFRRG